MCRVYLLILRRRFCCDARPRPLTDLVGVEKHLFRCVRLLRQERGCAHGLEASLHELSAF
jgi:hypothetical protein